MKFNTALTLVNKTHMPRILTSHWFIFTGPIIPRKELILCLDAIGVRNAQWYHTADKTRGFFRLHSRRSIPGKKKWIPNYYICTSRLENIFEFFSYHAPRVMYCHPINISCMFLFNPLLQVTFYLIHFLNLLTP